MLSFLMTASPQAALCMSGLREIAADPMESARGQVAYFSSVQMKNIASLFATCGETIPGEMHSTPYWLHSWSKRRKHGAPRGLCPFLRPFHPLYKLDGAFSLLLFRLRSGTLWPRLSAKALSGTISGLS